MKISELAEKTGLKAINPYTDREVQNVYISDMVSDIITGAKPGSVLVTLQTHKSLIAAANLVDVAAIVFTKASCLSDIHKRIRQPRRPAHSWASGLPTSMLLYV